MLLVFRRYYTACTVNDVLVDPYPFVILVDPFNSPYPFMVLKDQDVIDGPHCIELTKTSLFKKSFKHADEFLRLLCCDTKMKSD